MKSKIINFFLIPLFSIITIYEILSWREDGWISVIALSVFVVALTTLIVFHDHTLMFVLFIFVNHLSFNSGMPLAHFALFGLVIVLIPLLCLEIHIENRIAFFASLLLIPLYYIIIFIIHPFQINKDWVFLHLEIFVFFMIVQSVKWNLEKIMKVVSMHLFLFLIFGCSEKIFSNMDRIAGPMVSATGYGALLAVLWSIWFSYNIFKKKPKWILILAVTLLSFAVMMWTGTRMTLVGIGVAMFATAFLCVLKSQMSVFMKITASLLLPVTISITFAILLYIIPNDLTIKKSFLTLVQGNIDPSNMGRIAGWLVAWDAFQNNPVYGIGNGNFLAYLEQFFNSKGIDLMQFGIPVVPHAHNLYLIILSENGLLGFAIIITITIMLFINLKNYITKQKSTPALGLIVGLMVLLTLCLFDSMPFYPPTEAWGAWLFGAILQLPVNKKQDLS
jgi:O-antigen ligase